MATDLRAIRVAACYLLLGIGWILFSDQLLMALVADLETFARIGRYKGLCFVALTTVLIYGLLRHAPPPRPVPAGSPWPLLALFVALALAIVAVGANQVREARASRQAASMADLRAVSRLKRQEVADWLAVRARETASLRDSIDLPHGWPGGPAAAVSARLQALGRTFGAKGIWLVDADGRVLAGQAGDEPPADAGWRDLLRQAGSGGMPHSGLFKHAQRWHIDFAVALTPAAGGPPVFAVVRFDPADSLFAHFGDWPLPSTSAEVLLFRRAGDQVLVLNPVRYRRADAGAGFTLSLAAPELLSARALRGEIALGEPVEGIDYRGRPSVGVAQQVPGTHWFLLAKMDRSELFAGSERDIGRLVGSYLLVLLLAGAAAAYLYQRRGLAQAALLRQAQAERLRTLQLIDAIAAASSDAIFAKDREGRYILANAATCRALGLGESQIVGHLDEELFPPEYAAAFVADDRAVMASGQSRTYEEAVSTPAGVRTYMTTKGPLCDPDGTVRGIYAITRDITERKEAEAQLAQAAMVVSSTQDGVMVTDARGRILHVNQAFSVITGYREDEIRGQTARVLHSGRQTEADYAAMWQTLIATGSWQGEIWNRRKNGEIFPNGSASTPSAMPTARPPTTSAYSPTSAGSSAARPSWPDWPSTIR
ncbi:PAS domain-containing protein [Chitinimonas koreensis]|uniref:PAS domain-containing protein n=1 Tax=Chitinimonas koreensis TaxID=356302 RepID=UPI00223FC320|nr:PAS domain-containing protein [Chitinimonas koreensis]